MPLSWIAVEATTGRVIASLPGMTVNRVTSVLGDVTTCDGYVPIKSAPRDWMRATEGRASFLILTDSHKSATVPRPLWGGWVMRRRRNLTDTFRLTLSSLEAWLESFRITEDRTFTGISQTEMAKALVDDFALTAPIPLPLRVEAHPSTVLRDKSYAATSNKPVLTALQELSAIQGGPEFTVRWDWDFDDPDSPRILPTLVIADRIGSAPVPGLEPAATFSTGRRSGVIDAELTEEFGHGQYASDVMAWSSGVGLARPQSDRQVADDPIRPSTQFWYYPGSDITEAATLNGYAARGLVRMRHGAQALSITAVMDKAPRLGSAWSLGDDVGYQIGGRVSSPATMLVNDAYADVYTDSYTTRAKVKRYPNGIDSAPQFPGGLTGIARCVGWHLDPAEPATVTPILEIGGNT